MNDKTNEWETRYQAGEIGWDRGCSSENLNYWLDHHLLKPCRILIPGCGNGYEVMELVKRGFDVVAIDIAPTAINNLRSMLDKKGIQAEGKAALVLADFFSWHPEERFDAIFEQTSLCALSPEQWEQYEAQLYQWLKPQGKLFAQFMQTGKETGPPYHCGMNAMFALFSEEKWEWSEEYIAQEKEVGKTERLYQLGKI
jgi:cyclopropane fatty-acyl-phospholipid synthase-like methyltransferase